MRVTRQNLPPFHDALRYLANARERLTKAGRQNGMYSDKKYVRQAGNTAWSGVLIGVDEYLRSNGIEKVKGRKSKDWYTAQLSKLNRKLNDVFINAYDGLHLHLGYDGAGYAKVVDSYIAAGKQVIELCRKG